MRQVTLSSGIRNSWHRAPMEGIGRDHGIDNNSPDCNRRRRYPASILACDDMGGVFISPCNHTSGLSSDRIICLIYTKSDIFNNKNPDLVSRHAKKLWFSGQTSSGHFSLSVLPFQPTSETSILPELLLKYRFQYC